MNPLTIEKLQQYLKERYPFDSKASHSLFMKLVEEVGEVAEAINVMDGRKLDSKDTSLEKELVDVIHYTVAIACLNGIDLTKAIIEKDKVASNKYNHSVNLEDFLKK